MWIDKLVQLKDKDCQSHCLLMYIKVYFKIYIILYLYINMNSVQSFSHVQLFETPWTAARQMLI